MLFGSVKVTYRNIPRCECYYTSLNNLLNILNTSDRKETSQNKIKALKLVLFYEVFLHSNEPTAICMCVYVYVSGAWGWQPYHHPVPLSWNLGTLTSWNPVGHCRPVTGLLYLYIHICVCVCVYIYIYIYIYHPHEQLRYAATPPNISCNQ